MKQNTPLTAALLAALTLPAFAEEPVEQPAEDQAPAAERVELRGEVRVEVHEDGQQTIEAEQIELQDGEARVLVIGEGDGRVTVHFNGEAVEAGEGAVLNAEDLVIDFAAPDAVQPGPAPAAPERVEATYLGVTAEPLDFDTAKLMGVQPGTGLSVGFVSEGSPADLAGLNPGDVLLRLNDQVLVNFEQLAVLIRSFKAGEKVTLHVFSGDEPAELTAELGTAMVSQLGPGGKAIEGPQWRVQQNKPAEVIPVEPGGPWLIGPDARDAQRLVDMLRRIEPGPGGLDQDPAAMIDQLREQMRQHREEMDRMIQQMRLQLDLDLEDLRGEVEPVPGRPNNAQRRMQASMTTSDGEHTIALKINDGDRMLRVTEAGGAVLFDGPVPDDGRIDGLPAEVQEKVDRMLDQNRIQLRVQPAPGKPAEQENRDKADPAA